MQQIIYHLYTQKTRHKRLYKGLEFLCTYIYAFVLHSSLSQRKCLIYEIWSHYVCFGFCKKQMYCCSYHPTSDHYYKNTTFAFVLYETFFVCFYYNAILHNLMGFCICLYIITYAHCTHCLIKDIVSKYFILFICV